MNKCLTILLNIMIWDKHATPGGIASLFLCIVGGIIYEQAPMRGVKLPVTVTAEDEEFKDSVSDEVHKSEEEMDLIEKQTNSQSKRGEAKRRAA